MVIDLFRASENQNIFSKGAGQGFAVLPDGQPGDAYHALQGNKFPKFNPGPAEPPSRPPRFLTIY
jgi:hypothetical protein